MINNKNGFLQISFPWLFAIIVGIFILFLAIYGVTKLIQTEETIQGAKTSKEIGVLLNPLETGFEEAKASSITFPVETRVYNICNDFGEFGNQVITVSQMSFNKWTKTDIDVNFPNKYIFSTDFVEGKKMYVFSKPFDFPFKVTDLIYMTSTSDSYCFIDAPEEIQDEIGNLNQENLLFENCTEKSIAVCFSDRNDCDMVVNYNKGSVERPSGNVYFEGDALMYAAIFSSEDNYECQLKRLMKKISSLAQLYKEKSAFVALSGCNSNLDSDLQMLITSAEGLENSANLYSLSAIVSDIERKNQENSQCKLW